MTPEIALDIMRSAMYLTGLLITVLIVPSLVVGLIVSIFQAATSINEQTLTFFPRLLATLAAAVFAGPWILQKLMDHFMQIFRDIPFLIG